MGKKRARLTRQQRLRNKADADDAPSSSSARERIIESSLALFAERGVASSTLREVAERADLTLGGVQYHFATKEALKDAVFRRMMTEYRAAQVSAFASDETDFRTLITEGLRNYFRWARERPELVALGLRLAAEGDFESWPGEDALIDELRRRLRAAQGAGRLDPDVDPDGLLALAGSIMSGWVSFGRHYQWYGANRPADAVDEEFAVLVAAILLRGARPP